MRFAVIGTNWITSALISAGRTVPGFSLAAVYSRTPERAKQFAAEHGAPHWHASLAELGADPTVDAVYIASPNSLHAEQSIAMLRAGKHVLCEKPIAANATQAKSMFAAAQSSGNLLMEAYTTPFEPNFAAIRASLEKVGRVRRAVFSKDQYSSRYDRVLVGEVPNAFDPRMAAGSLVDIGLYTIAPAIHLFGPPQRVLATGIVLPTGVDGQGTVLLGYDGFEVVAMHSKIAGSRAWSHIEGESGTVSFDDCSVPTIVELQDRSGRVHDHTADQSEHHMRYEVEHFVGLVRTGATQSPVHTPERTLAVIGIIDQAREQVGVRFPADS